MTSALLPITYDPAQVAPSTAGLMGVVNWVQDGTEPIRFIDSGVKFRLHNVELEDQFGVWGEDWCADPDNITTSKEKDRTSVFPAAFSPITVYGFDHNYCGDVTTDSRAEVKSRALHSLSLNAPQAVETSLSARLVSDAGSPTSKTGIVAAVGYLEGELAKKGLTGFFHVGAQWAAYAADSRLNIGGRTPLGHRWVFGGGYVSGLAAKIVVTTEPYGWRGPVTERDVLRHEYNEYVAVAEQSLVVGYEAVVAAVTIA